MWVPQQVLSWFSISVDTVNTLREQVAALTAERDILKYELQSTKLTSDWLRMQFNTLQIERAALMEKAYGIKVAAPELVRTPVIGQESKADDFSFNDIGDELASRIGLPVYGSNTLVSQ